MKRRRKIDTYIYSRHRRRFAFFRYSSRVFIKVCSFSKYFEIGLTFFRSYAENTIGDYIPERSVLPMKEKNAGCSHFGINRELRNKMKLQKRRS